MLTIEKQVVESNLEKTVKECKGLEKRNTKLVKSAEHLEESGICY